MNTNYYNAVLLKEDKNDLSMVGKRVKKEEPPKETIVIGTNEIIENIDLNYIITNKPKPKIVREFMQANLESILGEEEMLFS